MTSDSGYFPRGESMLREVHGERVVGLYYGQRTTLIGALDALLYESTERHTHGKAQPFKRLSRTAKIMENIFFGTREQADKELARIDAMHKQVKGTMPKSSDPRLAGKKYSAYDPMLSFRTIGAMADSAEKVYDAFVRTMNDDEREQFWQDYLLLGELFGLKRDDAPASYREFRAEWDEWLADPELFLTDSARRAAMEASFKQPLPRPHQEVHRRLNYLIVTGTLPRRVREIYDLNWGITEQVAFVGLSRSMKTGRPLMPRMLRRGRNGAQFELVARTERFRQERGRETWQIG